MQTNIDISEICIEPIMMLQTTPFFGERATRIDSFTDLQRAIWNCFVKTTASFGKFRKLLISLSVILCDRRWRLRETLNAEENSTKNGQWTMDNLFVEKNEKAMCLVCNATVSSLKKYNIKRHYQTHTNFIREHPVGSKLRKS